MHNLHVQLIGASDEKPQNCLLERFCVYTIKLCATEGKQRQERDSARTRGYLLQELVFKHLLRDMTLVVFLQCRAEGVEVSVKIRRQG